MNAGGDNEFDELDAAMASKKRGRELALAEQEMKDAQDLEDKVSTSRFVRTVVSGQS